MLNGDRDGIPVVLIEAMACGVPVVSGDLPAIRELVHRIANLRPLLVDGDKPSQVASCLEELERDDVVCDVRRWWRTETRGDGVLAGGECDADWKSL